MLIWPNERCGDSTHLVDLGHCDGWGTLMEDDGDDNADVEQVTFWVRSLDSLGLSLTQSDSSCAVLCCAVLC